MAKSLSPTALKRWSCSNRQLPPVERIKRVHVYDFDNTLFLSPLPNKSLWHPSTYGSLQNEDFLHNGGWWHNPDILSATGEGIVKEEAKGWQGCWNEKIAELARMTAGDSETLGVLLTGRGEAKFTELLQRMITSQGLEFNMLCLKPAVSPSGTRFNNTLQFKTELLEEIMDTYNMAQEIRVYEDRPKHTKAFRDFFESLNARLATKLDRARDPFLAEVVQVTEGEGNMDPVAEVAAVQKMVNMHNQALLDGKVPPGTVPYKLKRNVLFTGYLTAPADTNRLKELLRRSTSAPDAQVKWLSNNILISPGPAPRSVMQKTGGMGSKMRWRVIGVGSLDRRVWAVRVEPAMRDAQVYTANRPPYIVVATAFSAKPIEASRIRNWQPISQSEAFEFDSVVGEKVLLRVDQEQRDDHGEDHGGEVDNGHQRKHALDEDFPPLGPARSMPKAQQRSFHTSNKQAWDSNRSGGIGFAAHRGNRGGHRDRRRGGDRGGRARGGRGAYRSLDANVGQNYSPSAMEY